MKTGRQVTNVCVHICQIYTALEITECLLGGRFTHTLSTVCRRGGGQQLFESGAPGFDYQKRPRNPLQDLDNGTVGYQGLEADFGVTFGSSKRVPVSVLQCNPGVVS